MYRISLSISATKSLYVISSALWGALGVTAVHLQIKSCSLQSRPLPFLVSCSLTQRLLPSATEQFQEPLPSLPSALWPAKKCCHEGHGRGWSQRGDSLCNALDSLHNSFLKGWCEAGVRCGDGAAKRDCKQWWKPELSPGKLNFLLASHAATASAFISETNPHSSNTLLHPRL